MSTNNSVFVGIDVSKARLDIAVRPTGAQWSEDNTLEGIHQLVEKLKRLQPSLIVMEATGGLEMAASGALGAAELAVAIFTHGQVRDFAKSLGRLAKTDRSTPASLPILATRSVRRRANCPRRRPRRCEAVLTRRRQLIEMLVAEENQVQLTHPNLRPRLKEHILWLEAALEQLDKELRDAIQADPAVARAG